ncbi:Membrane-associated phospholipid phosphatase [Pseudobutyrivibrio sp. AR14]|uniref:phosphatase PAP2 family protein n=1 Tax=Pseudobutyrivibrio sp. AR14 TaxID=1520804 RepID=UPI0008852BF9|nr:phosphatase PAP2 family protein [Pseudobutyrivibrio sp. AR14]SCY43548.1 Membrane-associated phospholipid phosphatase [Pseudobutyrivibrio sp. AR14]
MDIKYLLFLQNIRLNAPEWFNELIQFITDTAGGVLLILIPMIIFFCIDKKKGEFVLISFSIGSVLNVIIKNIFCIYRPWMRSELIKPTKEAIKGAGGYSFPSSHTQSSASSYGAIAYVYRKKKAVCAIFILLVLLVAFSRNYLGVHTPQDVIVAILEAIAVIYLTSIIQKKLGDSLKNRMIFYFVVVAVIVVVTAFMVLKNYPIDYNEAGKIIYKPVRAIKSYANKAGLIIGILSAWILEEKYIAFSTENLSMKDKLIRAIIGITVYLLGDIFADMISSQVSVRWIEAFVKNGIRYFCPFFFGPLIFTRMGAIKGNTERS